ncbi:MAG: hypothetical protein ABIN24_00540 [Dyadobacter sp.]
MKNFSLTSCFGKISKLLLSILIVILSGLNVNAQIKFTEGVIIYKVDSVVSDKPVNSSNISVSEIRLYKKKNLRRMDIISPPSTDSSPAFVISQILNEKGLYFLLESQLFGDTNKLASFESIQEIEKRKAQYALTGKIPEFRFKENSEKRMFFETQVETVYRIEEEPKRIWKLLVAKDIDTSFGFFLPEYLYLTGTPLQFYFDDNTALYHLTAQSIIKKPIDDALFNIGPEYDILPSETKISPSKKN